MHLDVLRKGTKMPMPGQLLVLTDNKSKATPGRVIKVEKDEVYIDFNHPLAGKTLIFTLKLLKIVKRKEC